MPKLKGMKANTDGTVTVDINSHNINYHITYKPNSNKDIKLRKYLRDILRGDYDTESDERRA